VLKDAVRLALDTSSGRMLVRRMCGLWAVRVPSKPKRRYFGPLGETIRQISAGLSDHRSQPHRVLAPL